MLFEGQSDEEDLDLNLALVVFEGVVPFVRREDGGVRGLLHDSVAVRVLAARCLDARIPEPFGPA